MQIKPLDNKELTNQLVKSAMENSAEEVIFLISRKADVSEALAQVILDASLNRLPQFQPAMQLQQPIHPGVQAQITRPGNIAYQNPQLILLTLHDNRNNAIDLLINKGADKNLALALVASKGSEAGVDLLVSKGANMDEALAIALERGDLFGAKLLISKGADKGVALGFAALKGDISAVDLLISKGADKGVALARAALKGDISAVDLLISKGANKDKALALTVMKNYVAAMDLLISKGANKDLALVYAALKGDISAVDLLISKGANKYKALAITAMKNDVAAMDLLISKGANKDLALVYAALKGDISAVDLLISKGANNEKALAIANNEKALAIANKAGKIAAVNLLKSIQKKMELEKAGAASITLAMGSGGASAAEESKEESVSDSGNDHAPDGGSSGAISVGAKRSRAEIEEYEEDIIISYFSNQSSSSSSNSNKAAKTDNSVSARSKKASLGNEANSIEGQRSDIQQNKQKKVKKELLSSKVLAHAAFTGCVLISNGAHSSQALADANSKSNIDKKSSQKAVALERAALQGDEATMDLLISEGADKEKALVRLALKDKVAAMDLLISKGADKNIAFIRVASKSKKEALDLLRSKGAIDEEALASIEKISSKILSKKDKIAAVNFLTKAHETTELEEASSSDSGDDLVSVSDNENNHAPDSGSSGAISVGVKRSRLENEEDQEEMVISSSSNQASSSISNSNKAAKTDSTVGAGSKRASLDNQLNSMEDQHSDIQQDKPKEEEKKIISNKSSSDLEIKTKLDDVIVHKSIAEQDLEDAERTAESILNAEEESAVKPSGEYITKNAFDVEYLLKNMDKKQVEICENKEISQLYQWGKWAYSLVENAINSPIVFTDNSGGLGAYSLSYDDGLPKIDMDSPLFGHMNEV